MHTLHFSGVSLNFEMVFLPLFRPEHRSFWRDQPDRGAAGMPLVACRGWEAPSSNPRQKREALEIGGIRAAFSLVCFFWRSKRKKLAFGCENPIQTNRDSDTK
ncbi:hypothetical protein [Methylomonas rivi]|uniref:Uncharacterized protein n=1 Tax=Methylomonas rivi TaxID=2952226 RepID=A0ABT1UAI1_9GAMM|nr:hypothetical protein [Methylomonas sp. WSC-6]MCQ8130370.1 hypothetical protein [Methylomonas sp. WSC-6]